MSTVIAFPLPECALCERPTRRDTHDANGGLCSACAAQVQALADSLGPR